MSTRSFVAPPAKSTRSRRPPIFPPRQTPKPPTRRHSISSVAKTLTAMATDALSPAISSAASGSSSSSSSSAASVSTVVHDSSLAPSPFKGDGSDAPIDWLQYFQRYVAFKQLPVTAALPLFALLMRGPANTWFTTLSDEVRNNYEQVLAAFHTKYDPTPTSLWKRASDFWSRDQKPKESVEVYVADMIKRATECHAADDMTRYAIIKGLRPEIRAYVLQQAPISTSALLEAAKIAEDTVPPPTASITEEVLEAIRRLETRSIASLDDQYRPRSQSPAPRRYGPTPGTRRVHFQGQTTSQVPSCATPAYSPPYGRQQWSSSPWQPSPYVATPTVAANVTGRSTPWGYGNQRGSRSRPRGTPMGRGQRYSTTLQRPALDRSGTCGNCGREHQAGACAARGQTCRLCNKRNHFARCCRSTTSTTSHFE